MDELISKQDVIKLIEEHSDLFDGYTDQQTFKDLIDNLPTLNKKRGLTMANRQEISDLSRKPKCKKCKHFLEAYSTLELYNEEIDEVELVDVKTLYCPFATACFYEERSVPGRE